MSTFEQDVSMRDLLASCAAASAVSTPPRAAEGPAEGPADEVRDAAPDDVAPEAA
ncbi:hypothetical protein ACF1G0_24000 [Streptomyces sp. NPDC013953]|uniref:hypothetical protein n=1 Tax=Streptomyces sp. NPDC013953 TaxID=3364868 RepID=UPI0036FA5BB2